MTDPASRIASEIEEGGPIPFTRFMELALYDPMAGYYAAGRAEIGCRGDYFTSASVGAVFGELLAGQFIAAWRELGEPEDFVIVEQGANDGQLAADALGFLREGPMSKVNWTIIEPFPHLREKQRETLKDFDVRWVSTPGELPAFEGIHFSNELFDALPVHIVRSKGDSWVELRVALREGRFVWEEASPGDELGRSIADLPPRASGYQTEIRLSHRPLLRTLAEKIRRGWVLVIDYGMDAGRLLAHHRTRGTISCYSRHRRDSNPLESPGAKDITAHVNFSMLASDALQAGFALASFTDQYHFLTAAAEPLLRSMDGMPPTRESQKKLQSLKTLLHPESMGTQFHYLLLSKNQTGSLPGFRHAKDPGFLLEAGYGA